MEQNGVNYYKGVLLCSRPNQSPSVQREKPFCGRVYPKQSLGLVPTKKYDERYVQKRKLPVLSNHKKWLSSFANKIKEKKQQQLSEKQKQLQKLQKVKQQAALQREKIKNSSQNIENQNSKFKKQSAKPVWAQTQKQVQQKQEEQVDQVLDFFQKGDIKDYLADQEIGKMLQDLKGRIQSIREKGTDWKKKQANRIKQTQIQKQAQADKKDDILSRISKQSAGQSVASQKTAQRVQQLSQKKQQKQWDKHTTTQKKTVASVDEQIAKNIADEVLRNYPTLKHHSNQSIRKLLQKHAHDQLKN